MTQEAISAIQEYFALEARVPQKVELRDFVRRLASQKSDLIEEFSNGLKLAEAMFGSPDHKPAVKRGRPTGTRNKPKEAPASGN